MNATFFFNMLFQHVTLRTARFTHVSTVAHWSHPEIYTLLSFLSRDHFYPVIMLS